MLDIKRLAKKGPCRRLSKGQRVAFLLKSGSTERVMYILVSGTVSVYRLDAQNAFIPAGTVSPGEAFGGREFFYGDSDRAYLADEDCIVYIISEATFYLLAKSMPKAVFEILRAAYAAPPELIETEPVAEPAAPEPTVPEPTVAEPAAEPEAIVAVPAVQVTAGGLFPEGHKGYPGITHPEYAKVTYTKPCTCPLCKKTFTGRRVSQSKLYEAKPTRFDLRKYYRDFQAEWYDFVVCPHCYCAIYQTYLATPKPFNKDRVEKELIAAKETVRLDFDAERDLDFVFASHYLALVTAPGYTSSSVQLRAKIWGNLSWLYEDAGDEVMMRYAAGKAAGAYEAVYMETELSAVQEQVTCLSVAGMLYRAGVEGDMKKYLFKAKTMESGNKTYTKLADDLMEMVREGGAS